MAVTCSLELAGIKGESKVDKFEHHSRRLSCSWGASKEQSAPRRRRISGGGKGNINAMSFKRLVNNASPTGSKICYQAEAYQDRKALHVAQACCEGTRSTMFDGRRLCRPEYATPPRGNEIAPV